MRPENEQGHYERRHYERGQSMAEYLIVLALVTLALTAGPQSPLEQLFDAVGERYQRFTLQLAQP